MLGARTLVVGQQRRAGGAGERLKNVPAAAAPACPHTVPRGRHTHTHNAVTVLWMFEGEYMKELHFGAALAQTFWKCDVDSRTT